MTRTWTAAVSRPLRDTTTRTALRGSGSALIGTFVGRAASVGALLVAARHLGSEQFGGLALALSTTLVITSISAIGLPVAAQKLVAEARLTDPPRRDRLIDVTVGSTAAIGVLAMAVGALSSSWVAAGILDQPAVASLLVLASVLILATPLVEVLAALLAAMEDFGALGWFRAAHGCAGGIALAVALAASSRATTALGALVLAELLACALGLRLVGSARGPRASAQATRRELLDDAGSLLRVAVPALIASVSLQPALWLGQVLLSRQPGGLEHVGTFAVAMRWQSIALFVPATMGLVLLPMLGRLRATGHDADARVLFIRYGALTLAFSTLTCLVAVVFAGPLMGLQGADYTNASGVLVVLAIGTVPAAMNNVLSNRALAEGRLALWVWSDLALSLTLAAGAVLLIGPWHGIGLALAYLAAYIATCVVLLPVVRAAPAPGRPT